MKKSWIVILLVLTLIELLAVSILYIRKSDNKAIYKGFEANIAIMVYDEAVGNYIQSNNVPIGSYKLNEEKTVCSAGGKVSNYDNLHGTLMYNLGTSDECYIYFDEYFGAVKTIMDLYKGQGTVVGDGKLYLHDETLANSAEDNSYRYSGKNPDNYACFEGDDCTKDDNKYRIIGVFGDNVKLIKHTSLGDMAWNTSGTNRWEGSSLEKYLNQTWLPTLEKKADLIDMTTWKVGGMNWDENRIAKNYYDTEKSDTVTLNRKIGLMYASDYGYAAVNGYWTTSLYKYNGEAHNNDWLYINNIYQWTVSRHSDFSDLAFGVNYTGYVGGGSVNLTFAARPVFFLTSLAKIKDGEGSYGSPYIVGE